jgi:hypothetical protein
VDVSVVLRDGEEVGQMPEKKKPTTRGRDAKTGRFSPVKQAERRKADRRKAERRKATAIVERVKPRKRKKK